MPRFAYFLHLQQIINFKKNYLNLRKYFSQAQLQVKLIRDGFLKMFDNSVMAQLTFISGAGN